MRSYLERVCRPGPPGYQLAAKGPAVELPKILQLRQADPGVVAGLSADAGGDDCRADRVVVFDSVPVGTGGGVAAGGSAARSAARSCRARDVCGRRDRQCESGYTTRCRTALGSTKCAETRKDHDIFYLVQECRVFVYSLEVEYESRSRRSKRRPGNTHS